MVTRFKYSLQSPKNLYALVLWIFLGSQWGINTLGAQSEEIGIILQAFDKLAQKKEWILMGVPEIHQGEDPVDIESEMTEFMEEYRVLRIIQADYQSTRDSGITHVSLFTFTSQVHAFGLYSVEKSPSLDFVDTGFESYYSHGQLITWYGTFVLLISGADSLSQRPKSLREMSANLIRGLPKQRRFLPVLDCLPRKNYVQFSEKFFKRRWLDQDYFRNIYYADYYTPEGYSRIFIIDNRKTSVSDSNFWKYYEFMRIHAEVLSDTLKIDTDYMVVNDPLWGKTILAKKNQIIYGILDYRNKRWAEERLADLLAELKKRKIVKPG